MNSFQRGALAATALLSALAHADVPVLHTDDAEVDVGVITQVLGFAQHVDDPVTDHDRLYVFMKEARFRTVGRYQDYRFNLELGLGGEDTVVAQTGVSLSLLDLSVDVPMHFLPNASLRVGQFKVPYGREALTAEYDSQFISRSINDLAFRVGRDVGAAFTVRPGPMTAMVGIFTGGGRDVPPQHYLPERLGTPLVAARVGVGNLDEDPYMLKPSRDDGTTRASVYVNGLYSKDSTIGHSTVFNVKLADKSLLLDSNWNPYIAKTPYSAGQWWQLGADAAVHKLAGPARLTGEAEFDWAGYSNELGALHAAGVRLQGAVDVRKFELALRYSALFPDAHFATSGVAITGASAIHEFVPSVAYYVSGQKLKVVADAPLLINTPVFIEKGVGAYVGTELPDQSSVLAKGGTVLRQDVIEARLMLQAAF